MRHLRRVRLVTVLLLCLIGVSTLPATPVAAANCAAIGPGANLAGCNLSWLDLSGTNLSGANLRGANLTGTNLDGANLSGANLSNATLTDGALANANTAGANLRGIRYVPGPSLQIATTCIVIGPGVRACEVGLSLANFSPSTDYSVAFYEDGGLLPQSQGTITTDGAGAYTNFEYFTANFEDGATIWAEVGGVRSGELTFYYQRCLGALGSQAPRLHYRPMLRLVFDQPTMRRTAPKVPGSRSACCCSSWAI
jgi:hypothetical protein